MKFLPLTSKIRNSIRMLSGLAKIALLSAIFMVSAISAEASHFRYGSMSWQKINNSTNQVQFKVKQAWRLTSYFYNSTPVVGQTVNTDYMYFGDGTGGTITLTITAVNVAEDWFFGEAVINHTYSSNGNYNAYFSSCCRIGGLSYNPSSSWNINANVSIGTTNSSPVQTISPIINVQTGQSAATFSVPAVDPDGDAVTYSLGLNPGQMTMNSSTGVITWNTVGKAVGSLWVCQATASDGSATVMSDFIIRIVQTSTPPVFDYTVTPNNGQAYEVSPGQPVNFIVKASDIDVGSSVQLSAVGLPPGAVTSPSLPAGPSNPVQSSFSWTPTTSQLGTSVISFTAQDNNGVQTQTSVSIVVSLDPVFDVPPTPVNAMHNIVGTNTNFTFTAQVSDADPNDSVRIYDVTGKSHMGMEIPLYAGASLTPFPTTWGNPSSGTFSWTPTAAQWGHKHVYLKAIDGYGGTTRHEIAILVNDEPVFQSTPVTNAVVGVPYSYSVVATDINTPYGDTIDLVEVNIPSWLSLTDNGDGTGTLSGTPSAADAGSNSVMIEAQDINHHQNSGGIPSQVFNIQVNLDNVPPTVITQNITIDLDINGAASITVNDIDNGTNDAFGIASLSLDQLNFTCSDIGANTVNFTAIDNNGNSASAPATVTVNATPTPIAVNDTFNLSTCESITITDAQLLANDSDPLNQTLKIDDVTASSGTLVDNGNGTYTYTPASNTNGQFTLTYTMKRNDGTTVFSGNGHFYEYVASSGITWTNAKAAAEQMTYQGLQGYLATITSAAENQFAFSKINGVGWIGASDAASEGDWKWVTGPEAGTSFWSGLSNGSSVNGAYENWGGGEPNNSGNEDYAHFLGNGQWNDLPNSYGSYVQGYVVEYGGNTGDCQNNSAVNGTVVINLNDVTAPNAVAQNLTVQLDASGSVGIMANQVGSASTDDCGIASLSLDNETFDCSNVGTNSVTLTATDINGNSSTAVATITVQDNTAPTAVCQNVTVQLDASGNGTISTPASTTSLLSEDWTGNSAGYYNGTSASGWTFSGDIDLGQWITGIPGWEIDLAGLSNSSVATQQSFNLTPGSYTLSFQHVQNSLSGNSVQVVLGSALNQTVGSTSAIQTATLNFTVNSSESAPLQFTQLGTNDPYGTFIGQISLVKNNAASLAIENGSYDNCSISSITASTTDFDCSNVGLNTITLTVTDVNGNIGTCNSTVTVEDNVNPEIATPFYPATAQEIATQFPGIADGEYTLFINGDPQMPFKTYCYDMSGTPREYLTLVNTGGSTNRSQYAAGGVASGSTVNTNWTKVRIDPSTLKVNISDYTFSTSTGSVSHENTTRVPYGAARGCAGAVANGSGNVNLVGTSFSASDSWTLSGSFQGAGSYNKTSSDQVVNFSGGGYCGWMKPSGSSWPVGGGFVLDLAYFGPTYGTTLSIGSLADINQAADSSICGAVVTWTEPQALDNCAGATLSSSHQPGSVFALGTTVVTYTATDASGNTSSESFNITITDLTAPVAQAQNVTVQLDASGAGSVTTSQINNGSNDACGIDTMYLDNYSFDCSNVGSNNTVTLTVTDNNANTTTTTATVTVEDNVAPVALTQNVTVQLDASGNGSIVSSDINNGSNDACGIDTMYLDNYSFGCGDVGANTATLTVTDVNGNSSTETATVTVEDNVAPVVVAQGFTIELDSNGDASISTAQVENGSNDACGIDTIYLSQYDFDCGHIGNNAVAITVIDVNGNVSTDTVNITVEDNIAPVITSTPANISTTNLPGSCFQNTSFSIPTFSDACGVPSIVESNDGNVFIYNVGGSTYVGSFPVGTTTVTYTATDANGNVTSTSFTVEVIDNEAPYLYGCPGQINVFNTSGSCGTNVTWVDPTPSDNCPNWMMTATHNSGDYFPVGNTVVTYTLMDPAGNTVACSFIVSVMDIEAPAAVCQDLTIYLDAAGNASVTPAQVDNGSTDNCGIGSLSLDTSNFDCSDVGHNTVTLTVTDIHGNSSTCTSTVTVIDDVAPNAIAQNVTVYLDANGAGSTTASLVDNGSNDACGIASMTIDNDSFTCAHIGVSNPVTLTVTDNNGNVSTASATVTVLDTVAPVAVVQNVTVYLDVNGAGSTTAAAIDNGSNDACGIASTTINTENFSCSDVGNNTILFTVIDNNGNSTNVPATVVVVDTIAPAVVTQTVTVQLDSNGNGSTTATAVDNGSSDACGIASMSISQTSFDCSDVGSNTVTLTVVDNNGNSASETATVLVEDNVAPVAIAQNVTVYLDANGAGSTTAAAIDNGSNDACGIASMTIDNASFTCANVGASNAVTLTVTDNNGNVSTASANVTVLDTVAPVVAVQNVTVYLDVNGAGSTTASSIDNGSNDACGIASTTIDTENFDCSDVGANTITFTATDNNGNSTSATVTVTVVDTIAPAVATQTVVVQLDGTGNGSTTASAVDNGSSDACGIASMSISPSTFDCNNVGSNTVTLTVVDNNGNSASSTATVMVEDNLAPIVVTQNVTVQLDAYGNGIISTTDVDNGSSDNCGIEGMTLDNTVFSCSDIGQTNTVTLTVNDNHGNSSSATAIVTVEDNVAPTALAQNVVVYLDATGSGSITAADVNNGSNDACGIASVSIDNATFSCSDINQGNVVTLTVTDNNGNISTATAYATVVDNIAPVVATQNATITLDENGSGSISVSDVEVSSTDACGIASVSVSQLNFDCSDLGSNTVTVSATDANGNVGTATATVTVEEGNFVSMSSQADIVEACASASQGGTYVSWPEPTASSFTSCEAGCSPNTSINGFTYLGEYNGHRYYRSNWPANWANANAAAQAAGGNLVSINSQGENDFVENNSGSSYIWIGLTDANNEGTFEWLNGDALSYTNWDNNEPNNNGGGYCGPGGADYVVMKCNDGEWRDRNGAAHYRYIVEISCSNPIVITQTGGGSNGSLFSAGTDTITYEAVDDVTGATASMSFTVDVSACPVSVYCDAGGNNASYEWIQKVDQKGSGIYNNSGNDGGYGDYTNHVGNVTAGGKVEFKLYPGFSSSSYCEYWRIYVDWNNDGDFTDWGELEYQGSGSGYKKAKFWVPNNAANGEVRMRVMMKWGGYPSSCSNFSYGEVEDYTLNVTGNNGGNSYTYNKDEGEGATIEDVAGPQSTYELARLYPNPYSNGQDLMLEIRSMETEQMELNIVSSMGQVVQTLSVSATEGINTLRLDVKHLAAGVYFVRSSNMEGRGIEFIVQ